MVFPNKENKILIGDSKKLTYYDLNELKEISSIYPNTETSEFFQCEADPHHQNLVFKKLLKSNILIRIGRNNH